ncbi:predicted protein [Nematostella vectensis]|uniref:Alpha-1,3-glucosyltransferase n=1 Tax=Nematostella vectensis TaxID=45351 RepID=A7RNB8_NEMVE|nr:predicted protein [Nematostella vectensis]|eukprot:XP_001639177.1 predicted protein [Nematostella vectensis]
MADLVGHWWLSIVLMASFFKLLFLRTYHSTDFEVHRNWLAITHSLPLNKWYYESTSEWTLDYPPLFAWFEFLLSHVAALVDPQMVLISKDPYASTRTVIFQRVSVIVTDVLLAYAAKEYCQYLEKARKVSFPPLNGLVLFLLIVFNFGLLIVDHIHFQYNGFLFGILLLSITRISEGRNLEGALLFATLLNFKHLFLYLAPAFFVYLLRTYCFRSDSSKPGPSLSDFHPLRLFKLAAIVIITFGASFGPFINMGQLHQVLSRLFPFKRGLCHAYWAPNAWALYNVLDKVVAVVGKAGLITKEGIQTQASMTGGLVGQSGHLVLPSIPPLVTMVLTLVSIMPALLHAWYRPSGTKRFLRCLVLCAYGSFMFGWHVHEKAVLMMIIPLSLLAVQDKKDARAFLVLSTAGHLSLFPLLFNQQETPLKICLMLMFTILSFYSLCLIHCGKSSSNQSSARSEIFTLPIVSWYEAAYICGLAVLEFYCSLIHPLTSLSKTLPFLPLLLTSTYCALGVGWSWMLCYANSLCSGANVVHQPMGSPPVSHTPHHHPQHHHLHHGKRKKR